MKKNNETVVNVKNDENHNEVMNQVIVRLNELKAVKMASLSKNKRPVAKFNKEVATYLLANWDSLDQLNLCLAAMRKDMSEGGEEVMEYYEQRIQELTPKKAVKLTKKNQVLLAQIKHYKDSAPDALLVFRIGDFYELYGKDAQEASGILNLIVTKSRSMKQEDGENLEYLGFPHSALNGYLPKMVRAGHRVAIVEPVGDVKEIGKKKDGVATSLTIEPDTAVTKEKPQNVLTEKRSAHSVGDIHPTQPWVWIEYEPGKFDWKSIKGKHADKIPADIIKAVIERKPSDVKAQPEKKASKTAKQSEKKPGMTLAQFLAKPVPSGLSKPQKNIVRYLKKGFRLRKDGENYWMMNINNEGFSVEKSALEALKRKYAIIDFPRDAWFSVLQSESDL